MGLTASDDATVCVADDFAHWINSKLRPPLPVGDPEFLAWRKQALDVFKADAREAAGKPPLACPPKGTKMGSGEFLTSLEAIPAAGRDIRLNQGFALVLAKRYPCARRP